MNKPEHIYTLGDYYKTPGLREDCHRVREGNMVASNDCAYRLAEKLPSDAVLLSIPSISGTTEAFARMVAYYANRPISFCLKKALGYDSTYKRKKRGEQVTESDTGIYCDKNVPDGHLVLVDNVMATGTTVSASIKAIGKPCDVACVAVDYELYEHYNETQL